MIIKESLFPIVDTKLRAGWHFTEEDGELTAFLAENFEAYSDFYESYNVELIRTSEHVFFLSHKEGSLIGSMVLSELDMLVGRLLCYMQINMHSYDKNLDGWITFDTFISELKSLVPTAKISSIQKITGALTDQEILRFIERVKTSLRRLKKFSFVSIKYPNEDMFIRVHSSIYRFASDIRGIDESDSVYRMIKTEVESSSLTDEVEIFVDGEAQVEELHETQLDLLTKDTPVEKQI